MFKRISTNKFQAIKTKLSNLSTTYFCDVCPTIRIMNGQIRAIDSTLKLIGQAYTVVAGGDINAVLKAIHHAEVDDAIVVVDSEDNCSALGGEIFATLGKRKKLAGIVLDGACRDLNGIKLAGLPYYAKSVYPRVNRAPGKGKWQGKINCGGIVVNPYDIVFADDSGIIVLSEQEFEELLPKAEAILEKEKEIFQKIKDGLSIPEIFSHVVF